MNRHHGTASGKNPFESPRTFAARPGSGNAGAGKTGATDSGSKHAGTKNAGTKNAGSGNKLVCSTCGRAFRIDQTKTPPFCSERCQLIDLGRWFDEEIGVPHEGGNSDSVGARPFDDSSEDDGSEDDTRNDGSF